MFVDLLIGYILGSIPFGWIFIKLAGLGDVRNIGSGTVGATNVMRIGGFKMALLTFIFDFLKAFVAVCFFGIWSGIAAIIGHNYPVWFGFKNSGKGFSASAGLLCALSPIAFLSCFTIWVILVLAYGYSSLAAMILLVIAPPVFGFEISNDAGYALIALAVIGFFQYRNNIKRLINGTEPKVEWRKKHDNVVI